MNKSPNIDVAEREKFNRLASTWWDPEGESRALHELNPARLRYVLERAQLGDADVLDVGCGGGIFSEALAAEGGRVVGIDIAEKALSVARLHLYESGASVDYRKTTIEDLALAEPGKYQVLTCMELLEHVPDPVSVIQACSAALRPGGHAFFSTLNRSISAFVMGIVGAEYVAGILPRGTHHYARFIRPSELSRWLRDCGFIVRDVCGLQYNPLTRTARLGGAVSVNYLIHAQLAELGE